MRRWGRKAGIAAATAVAVGALVPGAASAGLTRHGDLDLAYSQTTTSGGVPPPIRYEHSTYSPCGGSGSAGLSLVSGGARVSEDDGVTPFKLGQAWLVSMDPIDQIAPAGPDSWHEIIDNRSTNASLDRGDVAVCGDVSERSYVSNDKPSPKRARTKAKVSCPDGKRVLGGGGAASGPFLSQRLVASAPFDSPDPGKRPDDGWRIAVDNRSNQKLEITAHAICAPVSGLSYTSKAFRARKRKRKHAEAPCPDGEYVIGGGLTQRGKARKVSLVASYIDPEVTHDHWYVEVDNLSRKRFKGKVFAICHA
jgi:hypothetical protein